jgi:hypothetical protein
MRKDMSAAVITLTAALVFSGASDRAFAGATGPTGGGHGWRQPSGQGWGARPPMPGQGWARSGRRPSGWTGGGRPVGRGYGYGAGGRGYGSNNRYGYGVGAGVAGFALGATLAGAYGGGYYSAPYGGDYGYAQAPYQQSYPDQTRPTPKADIHLNRSTAPPAHRSGIPPRLTIPAQIAPAAVTTSHRRLRLIPSTRPLSRSMSTDLPAAAAASLKMR